MEFWNGEKIDIHNMYGINDKEDILKFIDFALNYSVDYIYILEDLQKMLVGIKNSYIPNDYIDY